MIYLNSYLYQLAHTPWRIAFKVCTLWTTQNEISSREMSKQICIVIIKRMHRLVSKLGHTFFSMPINGKSNVQRALENKNKAVMAMSVERAIRCGQSYYDGLLQGFNKHSLKDLLKDVIKDKDEFGVQSLLDLKIGKHLSFETGTLLLKEGFEGLWSSYRSLIEPRIMASDLSLEVCKVEIPIDVFSKDTNILARAETVDSIDLWEKAHAKGDALEYWKESHEGHLEKNARRSNATTTTIVTFFTIADACKVGLNGIIRSLLMQDAPSCMFIAPLLKWVVLYKWEKIWKKKSLRKLCLYVCFVVLYSIYSIWIAFIGKDLGNDLKTKVRLTSLVLVLMAIAMMMLCQETTQLRTLIKDGRHLFPKDPTRGWRIYWSSLWNIIEVLSYIILMAVIPALHFANLFGIDVLKFFYVVVAFETFLVWIKVRYVSNLRKMLYKLYHFQVWYYAQAFEGTGAFVLMIESVIKDCIPFLILTFVILVGFSLALFVLFQHSLQEKREQQDYKEDNEIKNTIEQCFGDPGKTMVTLFYAMIGTFEPKVRNMLELSF